MREEEEEEEEAEGKTDLCPLDLRPQACDLALDPRVDLLDLELVQARLVPDAALLEVEVEPDAGLGPDDLLLERLLELLDLGQQPLVLGPHQREVLRFEQLELRLERGEVDRLGVGLLGGGGGGPSGRAGLGKEGGEGGEEGRRFRAWEGEAG